MGMRWEIGEPRAAPPVLLPGGLAEAGGILALLGAVGQLLFHEVCISETIKVQFCR